MEKRVQELEKAELIRKQSERLKINEFDLNFKYLESVDITFEDLFALEEIQRIQDEFADATGVASIITKVDGTPITQPSNFCRLCEDIIRKTEKGLINCVVSDSIIGRYNPDGAIVEPCKSGGLWDAGAGIMVGGKHIANWMIGQVRNEEQTEDQIIRYAREIGVDESEMLDAFREIPSMSLNRFMKIAKMLFTIANQLSESAYQNLKKAHFINERKQFENNLKKSEEKYRALVESSSDFIWEVDQNGIYTYVSSKIKDILGYEPSKYIGKTPYYQMPRQDVERVRPVFQKFIAEKKSFKGLIREVYSSDGSIRLFETNGAPIFKDDGELVGFIGTDHDITENRKMQLRIENNEATLQSIFRATPIGIGMVTGHAIRWANEYLFEMTGYSRDELIDHDTSRLYWDQVELKKIRSKIYNQMKIDGSVTFESKWKIKNGDIIDVQVKGTGLDASNMQEGYIFTVQNITERNKFEKRLMDSERNYREIFNSVNDALLIHDTNTGAIIDINLKAAELYGYDSTELRGKTVELLSLGESPFSLKEATEWITKAIEEGPQLFEWMARNKSGEKFWTEVNLKNASIGGVDCILAVVRDIKERKANELELEAYREHLEEIVARRTAEVKAKNTELETFTYSVSHDLKAPLRGIDGYSRLLEEEYANKLDEEGLQFLDNIRRSTEQMQQLIEDLLTYSRMERRDLNSSPLSVRQLIDELLFEREHEINAKLARITTDISHDQIVGDRESVRQILGNFIDNALKFTTSEGEPKIKISVSKSTETWHFSVEDNGIGFDPKYGDRIFGIFQRLHRVEDFPGTGVGLALVKKAASRMNGRTWAEGRPGQGATFHLEFPEMRINGD